MSSRVISGLKRPPPESQSPRIGRSSRDLVLVRFDKKKDHRELQTTSGGNMFTLKAGFSKERAPDIDVKAVSETIFAVVPASNLPDGEYIILPIATAILCLRRMPSI